MYSCFACYVFVHLVCACLRPVEAWGRYQMPWDWSYRWLWTPNQCWELNLGFLDEQQAFLAVDWTLQLLILLLIKCVCVCVGMCAQVQAPTETRRGFEPPEASITDRCESPDMGAGNWAPGPL